MEKSLYIHIPFCRSKCAYCDFYSINYDKDIAFDFVDVLSSQIEELPNNFTTIYIGGGTPTALDRSLLVKLLKSLRSKASGAVEFTIEANPESLTKEKIKLFLREGINRISIGFQSFENTKLKKLSRIHTSGEAASAVYLAKRGGFKNISVDLIFGVWGQSLDEWKGELSQAVKLPINHISTYALTYEKHTPIFKRLKSKEITPLTDSAVALMYEHTQRFLSKKGFSQYEVSSFAREGCVCRHNLIYWDNGNCTGLGPCAVSFFDGRRTRNIPYVQGYIDKVANGKNPVVFEEKLSGEKLARETAALKIRTRVGVDFAWFRQRTGYDFCELMKDELSQLIDTGLLRYRRRLKKKKGVCLRKKGFLFADTVSSAFL